MRECAFKVPASQPGPETVGKRAPEDGGRAQTRARELDYTSCRQTMA